MKSDIVDVDGMIEAKTERAVLFHTGDKDKAQWLPLSQVELTNTGVGGIYTATMPEWLALDKGFI